MKAVLRLHDAHKLASRNFAYWASSLAQRIMTDARYRAAAGWRHRPSPSRSGYLDVLVLAVEPGQQLW
jgi:hypothetical protein